MADPLSTVKGKKKIKKDLMSKNCSLTEFNGERLSSSSSRLPGLRGQKYSSNSNLEKLSFISEKDFATYENYKVDYSNYLLKKLQSHLLLSNKKQKEDNLKRCLVSLKLELEAVLKDHVNLHKSSAYARVYMDIIQECNKRIELGENILKLFEENKLDDLFMSVSSILDPIINQLLLVEINKNDIEKIFSQDVIGENSNLIECLKKIHSLSAKNKDTIDNIAAEIVKIEDLCKENSVLREG